MLFFFPLFNKEKHTLLFNFITNDLLIKRYNDAPIPKGLKSMELSVVFLGIGITREYVIISKTALLTLPSNKLLTIGNK